MPRDDSLDHLAQLLISGGKSETDYGLIDSIDMITTTTIIWSVPWVGWCQTLHCFHSSKLS